MSEHLPLPDRAWFTPLLNRIADIAGERAALILGREKAGQQIYIPGKAQPGHWLVEMIGIKGASAMGEVFGDKMIVIPQALAGDKRRRAATIAQMADKGYSIGKIVQLTGLSRSTVAEHVKRYRATNDSPQGNLF